MISSRDTTKLLLGSGGFLGQAKTVVLLKNQIDLFLGSEVSNVLIIPYAQENYDLISQKILQHNLLANRSFTRIDTAKNPVLAIQESEAILVFGGNTFRLLNALYQNRLLEPIRKKVKEGMPYIGISAGTNVACPTIMTTNDMPIVQPPSFNALNLISFQINPHYISGPIYSEIAPGEFEKYAGETRDDRILEYHQENNLDVVGLPEATFLHIEDGNTIYINSEAHTGNSKPLKLFRKGLTTQDFKTLSKIAAGSSSDKEAR